MQKKVHTYEKLLTTIRNVNDCVIIILLFLAMFSKTNGDIYQTTVL